MYSVLPHKYHYKRNIVIAGLLNISCLFLLLNSHGSMVLSSISFKPTHVSAISIKKYNIIQKKKKPDLPITNTLPKDLPKKNTPISTDKQQPDIKNNNPQHKDITKKINHNNNDGKIQSQEDMKPVTEATHFGIKNKTPQYPIISFQLGEYGNVTIEYIVSKNGTVQEASIVQSSGFARLDKIALLSFKKWKFKPAKNIIGQAVESQKKIITFAFDIKTQQIKTN